MHGRMLPDGLRYLDSWIVANEALDHCFQLMETDDRALVDAWIARWRDLGTFEVHEVISSAEAAARVAVCWPGHTEQPEPSRWDGCFRRDDRSLRQCSGSRPAEPALARVSGLRLTGGGRNPAVEFMESMARARARHFLGRW
jgi:hypothetical protein